MKKIVFFIVLTVMITVAVAWGPIVSNVEQAKYIVVQVDGNIELRDYPSMIVAEVEASGERKEAISQGFRVLADYIFGGNSEKSKISMTSPVTQEIVKGEWTECFMQQSPNY